MKRFSKVFLVLVALILLGYFGYKEIKKSSSLLGKVHVDANSAIKIGLQEIKETIVLDALTSPIYYYERAKFSGSDGDDIDKGIDLSPYNLVLFTMPNVKNTFFSTLNIRNSEAFEEYIAREIEKKSATVEKTANGDYRFAKIASSKIVLAWNGKQLVMAMAPALHIGACHTIFKDILTQGKTITDGSHELIKSLADHDGHVVFITGNSSLALDFEDGKAVLAGNLLTETPQKFPPEITVETTTNASFQVYFDTYFENPLNKKEIAATMARIAFFQKNALNSDEIADRTNGYFSLAIAGTTKQTDTIITFGYDANFEKVEERTLREKQVPQVHINLGAEQLRLKDYLIERKAIDSSGIFTPFPLYDLYTKDGPRYTVFDTFKGAISTQDQISSNFFACRVDFQKLNSDIDVPQLKAYFQNLEKLKLFAAQKERNRVAVSGELSATNPEINILSQLVLKRQLDSIQ